MATRYKHSKPFPEALDESRRALRQLLDVLGWTHRQVDVSFDALNAAKPDLGEALSMAKKDLHAEVAARAQTRHEEAAAERLRQAVALVERGNQP